MGMNLGILTSGGDCPGLNAAIRAVGKASLAAGLRVTGFRDGFCGLVFDRSVPMGDGDLSGILTIGGTVLGTSRFKPHAMPVDGEVRDLTESAVKTFRRHRLDVLVCLGGGGTAKNALHLQRAGLRVVTLPKTIDNDVAHTDTSFGFDTALQVATDAVDRLHSTATSHGRIIVVELMGHRAGWLALGAGIAGGADVILLPEIPYDLQAVVAAIRRRSERGKNFSIVAVAEGAMSRTQSGMMGELVAAKHAARGKAARQRASEAMTAFHDQHLNHTLDLTRELERLTGLESRLTILGHLQRGGSPSAGDRILATKLGVACVDLVGRGVSGVMVASRGDGVEAVPLEAVAGQKKLVPPDHPWLNAARQVGTCLGDRE